MSGVMEILRQTQKTAPTQEGKISINIPLEERDAFMRFCKRNQVTATRLLRTFIQKCNTEEG
jgi:hypothetical protein